MENLPLDKIPYHATEEQIELAFQKLKFAKEQEARIELKVYWQMNLQNHRSVRICINLFRK